jgi:hypothetical protein
MAVREFTDSRGVDWRAWDVTPAHMHPVTRGEDYMANLQDGWLVFESGREKRRLEAPYPADWITMPIPKLEELCRRASLVVRRHATSNSGQRRAISAAEIEQVAARDEGAAVTFHSPRGREWTVNVHDCLDADGNPSVVLRFTSGDVIAELPDYPADWRTATTKDFALMLLDADPPLRRRKGQGPQRRREDRSE